RPAAPQVLPAHRRWRSRGQDPGRRGFSKRPASGPAADASRAGAGAMTARQLTIDASKFIIWRACRHLPPDIGQEKDQEWTAALPFVFDAPLTRFRVPRMAAPLAYAADQHRTVHHHPQASRYNWVLAVSDAFAVIRFTSYARSALGIASLYVLGGAIIVYL